MRGRPRRVLLSQAGLAGFRFPPEVIVVAVHCTCATACHTGNIEELLTERVSQLIK